MSEDFELPNLDEETQEYGLEAEETTSPKSATILTQFQKDALAKISDNAGDKIRISLDGILSTAYGQDTDQALVDFLGKSFGIEEESREANLELNEAQEKFKSSKPKERGLRAEIVIEAAAQVAAYAIIAGDEDRYNLAKSICETSLESFGDVAKPNATKVDAKLSVAAR